MKKPVEELDLDFDNISSGLYVVYDSTSNLEVSDIITARNDAMAIEGFIKFLEAQKNKNRYSHYVLKSVGLYNHTEHRLTSGEEYDILSDNENLEEYSQAIYDFINSKEV